VRLLLLLFFLLTACGGQSLTLYDLSGREVKLPSSEKPLLLYVWSGTCVGHGEDLKRLSELYPKLSEKYEVYAVAVFMKPEDALAYLKKEGIEPSYPLLVDPTGRLEERFKLLYLPATLILEGGELKAMNPRLQWESQK